VSLLLSNVANVGLNIILISFISISFCLGALYIINRAPSPESFGFLRGGAGMMIFTSFTTAVYWGQLSRCEPIPFEITQYTCSHFFAMRMICFLSLVSMIIQSIFLVYLIKWHDVVSVPTVPLFYETVQRNYTIQEKLPEFYQSPQYDEFLKTGGYQTVTTSQV